MNQQSTGDAPKRQAKHVFVVLPAYNEEARIGKLLDHIDDAMSEAAIMYTVIVVNDGSKDATAQLVTERSARMPVILLNHPINLGLGATIRDGLFEAANRAGERDVIVTMDADDTHTPGLILRMTRMISEGYDVIVASRYREGSRTMGVPFFRRFVSYGGSWMFRLVFPIKGVRDFTCGFRAYRAGTIKEAIAEYGQRFVDQEGFQCMVDILLKLRRRQLIFGEVPFILRYDLKEGGTKMNVKKTIFNTLRLMVKRRVN